MRRGHSVQTAPGGKEALEVLATSAIELVLLDVQMPQMSGLEVLQAIRSADSTRHIAVLMVTANGDSEDVVVAFELGADDYITKPIDVTTAIARIQTQLLRKRAEDRVRESEERYALAAAGSNDGLWDWNLRTNDVYFSTRWKAILGHADDEIGDRIEEWFERIHAEDRPRVRREVESHLAGLTDYFESEYRIRSKPGGFLWMLTRGLARRDENGMTVRVAGSQTDITERKFVDALTGLPNRLQLAERLERGFQRSKYAGGQQFAVLVLDLDGFKVINNSIGLLAGDELLQWVAQRLQGSLRASDRIAPSRSEPGPVALVGEGHTLARLGGDEFVVLLQDVQNVHDATRVADRIHRTLAQPFHIDGREVFTAASIGIAVSGRSYTCHEDVLRDADTAMQRAKALGRGRTEVFDALMREHANQRLQLDGDVRRAIERHEFVPYYQPLIDLSTGSLVGFEALLRWRRPDRDVASPAEFLPLIEENGLVGPIGWRLLEDVCAQLHRWHASFPHASRLWVNVNFASQQLLEPGLATRLTGVLDETELLPEHMVIEVTEATAISNFTVTTQVLQTLRDARLRVVLDDFGTGHSSLACLDQLPITGLKLDPTFTGRQIRRSEILRAVVTLARDLGLTVTAEGIETREQCRQLYGVGCHFGQGYLFARPLDAEGATAAVRSQRSWLSSGDVHART
jgi:PAS domain S-box-containing protein